MFKLVVLLSAVALAASAPSVISPLALAPIHSPSALSSVNSPLALSSIHSPLALSLVHSQLALSSVHSPLALSSVHSPLAIHSAAGIAPLAVAHSPLALSPHSPAVVLNAYGVPLGTPDVVAARNLHLQAKALAGHGLHLLKKRSLVGPLGHGAVLPLSAPLISSHGALSPLVHSSHLLHSAPVLRSAPLLHSVPNHSGIQAW